MIRLVDLTQAKPQEVEAPDTNTPLRVPGDNFLLQQSVASHDTSTLTDPFRALCRMKEEHLFIFSGFNDAKLLVCEAFDV